jgi:hypothetical protein
MRYPQLDNATEWRAFLLNTELQIELDAWVRHGKIGGWKCEDCAPDICKPLEQWRTLQKQLGNAGVEL